MGTVGLKRWFFVGCSTPLFSVVSVVSRGLVEPGTSGETLWDRILKTADEVKALVDLANGETEWEDVGAFLTLIKAPAKILKAKLS